MSITREELAQLTQMVNAPIPRRLIVNPNYLANLRMEAAPFPGGTFPLEGLEVVENGFVETFAVQYSDGSLRVPGRSETADWVCTGCGCTEERACIGGCCWVGDRLCSTCAR